MSELTEWWIRPRTTLRRADVIDVPYGDLRNRFLDQGYVWVVNKGAYDAMKADRDRLRIALADILNQAEGINNPNILQSLKDEAARLISLVATKALEQSKQSEGR